MCCDTERYFKGQSQTEAVFTLFEHPELQQMYSFTVFGKKRCVLVDICVFHKVSVKRELEQICKWGQDVKIVASMTQAKIQTKTLED